MNDFKDYICLSIITKLREKGIDNIFNTKYVTKTKSAKIFHRKQHLLQLKQSQIALQKVDLI